MAIAVPGQRALLAVLVVPPADGTAGMVGSSDVTGPSDATAVTALAEPHQLRAQLTALGCATTGPVTLDALPGLLDGEPAHPAVVLDGRTVAHDHALRMLVRDDRDDMTVLPDSVSGAPLGLRLSSRVTGRLTALPAGVRLDQLAVSIGRHGELTARELSIGALVAAVPTDAEAALAIAAAIADTQAAGGEEAVRLEQSVKRLDNPIAAHLVGPWSRYLGRWLLGHRVSPDAVTVASLVVALAASALACLGTRPGYLLASIGILASFALDCTDGQMARYAVRFSSAGSWLDGFGDRIKEQLFLAGLAIGGVRAVIGVEGGRGASTLWWLAAAAGGITVIRHFVGFGYTHALGLPSAPPVPAGDLTRSQRTRFDLRKIAMLPFGERTLLLCVLAVAAGARVAFLGVIALGGLAALAMAAGRVRRTMTKRRTGPTSEAADSVAALADVGPAARAVHRRSGLAFSAVPGSLALAGLPVAGLLGFVGLGIVRADPAGPWLTAVALVAASSWWVVVGAPLGVRPHGWLTWLIPAATATVELATVLAATASVRGLVDGPVLFGAATFALLALVALHRYDREYVLGLAGGGGQAGRWSALALGHEGRTLAIAVLSAAGVLVAASVPAIGVWVLAALVGVAVVGAAATELGTAVRTHRARA